MASEPSAKELRKVGGLLTSLALEETDDWRRMEALRARIIVTPELLQGINEGEVAPAKRNHICKAIFAVITGEATV